jgi:superfamily II DNA or RNA helicase
MDKTERTEIRRFAADFGQLARKAAEVSRWHQEVQGNAAAGEETLRTRSLKLNRAGQPTWRVTPLSPSDTRIVQGLWERSGLPELTPEDHALLSLLTADSPRALADVSPVLGVRRFFAGAAAKQAADGAAVFLRQTHAYITATDAASHLTQLGTPIRRAPERITFEDLLDPAVRSNLHTDLSGPDPEIFDRSICESLPASLDVISKVLASESSYRSAAHDAGEQVRRSEVQRILQEMPVEALRAATRGRLHLGALTGSGITSIQEVLNHGRSLMRLPGIGETSARRMLGAAQTLWQTTYDEMPVRIDINNRHPETALLLHRLAEWDLCRVTRGAAADLERATELAPMRTAVDKTTSHLLVIPTRGISASGLRESIQIVNRRAELLGMSAAPGPTTHTADPWDDFLVRPADYFAMLSELGFITEDEDASHGDLPEEIIQAVRDQALSGEHMTASLRGYQSFAARFALVQRKVIVGDEMGLGKTVEALAVLAHLRSHGETHFVVVCPAAVVTNWMREVTTKSKLRPHCIYGPDRERAARSWRRDGGVAVTTFETLAWWGPALTEIRDLACVVVDEAHYIKNPQALRTTRTRAVIARSDRAILLTGTPLENRVDEFRNLASYVRPDLTVDASDLSPKTFRRQIAPAYLRRNQEDVLSELPGLIEVEEWLPMSPTDAASYRDAVEAANFMAMRQAAMVQGDNSVKLQRLTEIVKEAEENQRRVIVFSHFREVLSLVARSLPGPVFGPLTGSVRANQRQQMVDQFSSARHGAVLVAQIVAGGVGLNIQSASVVIICEPQLKPTTEAQAIARAHRMGQVQSVQVHRLLSENSVDQRITDILARKRQLFDEFARLSETAESTPEAVDLTEAELVREVVAAERARLFGKPAVDR